MRNWVVMRGNCEREAHVCSLDMVVDESEESVFFFLSVRGAEQDQLCRREEEVWTKKGELLNYSFFWFSSHV